jgi:hypothetical protein
MITRVLVAILCCAIITGCEEDTGMDASSFDEQELLDMRREKDEAFRTTAESPIPEHMRDTFKGLKYFAPSEEGVVDAAFVPATSADTITMTTTTSELRPALRAGRFTFSYGTTECSLTAFQFLGGPTDSYFVPFTDRTTGETTYRGGRYLDIERTGDSVYVIDFNRAYNPFCAYNDAFSCPRVPRENNLPVAVTVGEQSWK